MQFIKIELTLKSSNLLIKFNWIIELRGIDKWACEEELINNRVKRNKSLNYFSKNHV